MYGWTSYTPPLEYAPERLPSFGSRSIQRSLNARWMIAAYSGPSGATAPSTSFCASSGVYSSFTDDTSGA